MLRELRLKKDLTQEEVVEAVAALESENRYWDDRTLRRYESGEIRPPRTALILTVVNALKETDPEIVNHILDVAHYATLSSEEVSRYGLSKDRFSRYRWIAVPDEETEPERMNRIPQVAVSGELPAETGKIFMTSPPSPTIYIHLNGKFQKEGPIWKEYRNDVPDQPFIFKEILRNHEFIYLYDETKRRDPGRPIHFRIPIQGGVAQWTFPNPIQWEDVLIVKPQW